MKTFRGHSASHLLEKGHDGVGFAQAEELRGSATILEYILEVRGKPALLQAPRDGLVHLAAQQLQLPVGFMLQCVNCQGTTGSVSTRHSASKQPAARVRRMIV